MPWDLVCHWAFVPLAYQEMRDRLRGLGVLEELRTRLTDEEKT